MADFYAIFGKEWASDFKGSGYLAVTTHAVRQRITATKTPIAGVVIQPLAGNTNDITIGDVTVVGAAGATHVGLNIPKGSSVYIPIRDLSLLYADCITDGDAFYYTCIR